MHVRFKYAWHGKVHKQNYKLSAAQYATKCILTNHHIQLFSSLPFNLLNNIKIVYRAGQYQMLKYAYEDFPELLFVVPASFKLA